MGWAVGGAYLGDAVVGLVDLLELLFGFRLQPFAVGKSIRMPNLCQVSPRDFDLIDARTRFQVESAIVGGQISHL